MAPAKNIPITGSIMLEKASQSAEKLEKTDFKAIGCWLSRLKTRHEIVLKKCQGEVKSADESAVMIYFRKR